MTLFTQKSLNIPRLKKTVISFASSVVRVVVPCGTVKGKLQLKAGDRAPALAVLLQNNDGSAFDLSGWSAPLFYMRPVVSGSSLTINAGAGTITGSGTAGAVGYTWATGQTSTAGEYLLDFSLLDPSGLIRRFPGDGYIKVVIHAVVA